MESQNRQASRTEAKPSVASNFYPRDGRERFQKLRIGLCMYSWASLARAVCSMVPTLHLLLPNKSQEAAEGSGYTLRG